MKPVKSKNSPWTKLGIKCHIDYYLTRRILLEKYSIQEEKIKFLISTINDCELFIHSAFQNTFFYIKEIDGVRTILLEKHNEINRIFIRYPIFWEVFESRFNMKHSEIKEFTEHIFKHILSWENFIVGNMNYFSENKHNIENELNTKGFNIDYINYSRIDLYLLSYD